MVADTRKIEQTAINSLKTYLLPSEYIEPYIDENDKTPCWDGYVFLYRSKNKTVSNIRKRIDVQVKGHQSEYLDDKQITYSVNKEYLRNYYIHGGVIFFVVYISSDYRQSSIYYSHLSKIQLKNYLNVIEERNQFSISILLNKILDDLSEYEELLLNFSEVVGLQIPATNLSIENIIKKDSGFDSLKIKYVGIKYKDDPFDYIFNHPTTLYAHNSATDIDIPFQDNVILQSINLCKNTLISNDGKDFYTQVQTERLKDKTILHLGKSFDFTFTKEQESMKLNFHFQITGFLSERINDIRFLLSFLTKRSFFIDGKEMKFPFTEQQLNAIDIAEIENDLNFYEKIKSLLDYFGVEKDLDVAQLTEDNKRTFCLLIDHVLLCAKLKRHQEEPFILQTLNIANISFLFAIIKLNDEECKIYNYFREHFGLRLKPKAYAKDLPYFDGSQYFILEEADFEKIDNINYQVITNDILKVELLDEVIDYLVFYILSMLRAYDKQKEKKGQLIDSVSKISDFVLDNDNVSKEWKTVFLLNKLQAVKRIRSLNTKERKSLMDILNKTVKIQDKIDSSLLLDNQEQAKYYFDSLSSEQQELYKTDPINIFWSKKKLGERK